MAGQNWLSLGLLSDAPDGGSLETHRLRLGDDKKLVFRAVSPIIDSAGCKSSGEDPPESFVHHPSDSMEPPGNTRKCHDVLITDCHRCCHDITPKLCGMRTASIIVGATSPSRIAPTRRPALGALTVAAIPMPADCMIKEPSVVTSSQFGEHLRIAAIVPCYNEEASVALVVADLIAAVPGIQVYVYDNNSSDRTSEVAAAAGAIVRREERKGKGNVVRRAFADVDADVYLLIDGDDTYEAAAAPQMIEMLLSGPYDHVLGCRADDPAQTAYRPGHAQGNRMFNRLVGSLFGERVTDMLSGYRVFSRRFVKSFPALSSGFEIETELTVHSMALRVPQREVAVGFKDRPEGSESKLNTFSDGFKILWLITRLFAHERPFAFHGFLAALSMLFAVIFGIPVIVSSSIPAWFPGSRQWCLPPRSR
ncbi:hypothetical protein FQR65_LT20014 [Abscondita terminalis]|nr:hypothetical protein FQR65_LT20014 [Abscondita terminalis]